MKKSDIVSVSLVAQVCRCPYAASRDAKGAYISEKHKSLRAKGDAYHESINEKCIKSDKHHGRKVLWLIVILIITGVLLWVL